MKAKYAKASATHSPSVRASTTRKRKKKTLDSSPAFSKVPAQSITFPYGTSPRVSLYRHQVVGVNRLVKELKTRGHFALLDDCGLGKTLQMLYAARDLIAGDVLDKVVIVCKADLVSNWVDECAMHVPDLPVQVLSGKEADKRTLKKRARIYLINFELISQPARTGEHVVDSVFTGATVTVNNDVMRIHTLLRSYRCGLFIDESHRIKNCTARTTDTLCSLRRYARCRAIATATLEAETPLDAFAQVFFLDGGKTFGRSYTAFCDRYAIMGTSSVPLRKKIRGVLRYVGKRHDTRPVGYQNLNEMRALVQGISLRRTQAECPDLPARINKRRVCTATGKQLLLLRTLRDKLCGHAAATDSEHLVFKPGTTLAESLHMFLRASAMPCCVDPSIKGGAKFAALLDMLHETKDQCVIWCTHRNVAQALSDTLNAHNQPSVCVYGGFTAEEKDNRLRVFKSGNVRLLVATGRALQEGHNFQNATQSITFQVPWERLTDAQGHARVHRIGQTRTVIVTRLLLEQSLDGYQLRGLRAKNLAVKHASEGGTHDALEIQKQEFIDALKAW